MNKILIAIAFCSFLSTSLFAHGGHTAIESNMWHYLFSPEHLLLGFGGLLIASIVVWHKRMIHGVVRIGSQKKKQQ